MEAYGRQIDEGQHAAHGAAGRVEAEARLLGSVQVQAQVALDLLAQPPQQPLLDQAQQLVVICLRNMPHPGSRAVLPVIAQPLHCTSI